MKQKTFTISAYTENTIGLLGRITIIFTRRRINIESLTVSETESKGIARFTIVIYSDDEQVRKVVQQINKIIEVIHAEYHTDSELIYNQIALFKVTCNNKNKLTGIRVMAEQNNGKILVETDNYVVLEKTGSKANLDVFLRELQEYGETEYVRSGRVALTTAGIRLREILLHSEATTT